MKGRIEVIIPHFKTSLTCNIGTPIYLDDMNKTLCEMTNSSVMCKREDRSFNSNFQVGNRCTVFQMKCIVDTPVLTSFLSFFIFFFWHESSPCLHAHTTCIIPYKMFGYDGAITNHNPWHRSSDLSPWQHIDRSVT